MFQYFLALVACCLPKKIHKKTLFDAFKIIRKPPLNHAQMAFLAADETYIVLEERFEKVEQFEVKKPLLSSNGLVMVNHKIMPETVLSLVKNDFKLKLPFYKQLLRGNILMLDQRCVFAHNAFSANYYHFVAETLTRLFLLRDFAHECCLIMPADLPPFVKEYLALFDFKNIVWLQDRRQIIIPRELIFTALPAKALNHQPKMMLELASFIKSKTNNTIQNPNKKIFITRKNASYRKTINEQEIIDFLMPRGFEIVALEHLTVLEQITLFAHSKHVIGSHGAGFTNILYANEGSTVMDLIHFRHTQRCFYTLSDALNLNYIFLQCNQTKAINYANNDDIWVDMNVFECYYNQYFETN